MWYTYKMSSGEELSMKFCEENPTDERCSCYNVMYADCEKTPDIPGCKESNGWKNSILELVPNNITFDSQRKLASRELDLRRHCGTEVCSDDKYRPPDYKDLQSIGLCNFQLDICASDVQVGETTESKYFRNCSLNETPFIDLDSVYGLDPSVMYGGGIRTAENAAYVAAKNKILQLKLRREQRAQEEEYRAKKEIEEEKKIKIQDDKYDEETKGNRVKLIAALVVAALIILIIILNLR